MNDQGKLSKAVSSIDEEDEDEDDMEINSNKDLNMPAKKDLTDEDSTDVKYPYLDAKITGNSSKFHSICCVTIMSVKIVSL